MILRLPVHIEEFGEDDPIDELKNAVGISSNTPAISSGTENVAST